MRKPLPTLFALSALTAAAAPALADINVGVIASLTGPAAALGAETKKALALVPSSLGGETVLIQAGRDLTLTGSNAVADADIALIAGRDLTLEAATETYTETHFKDKKKSGFSASLTTGLSYGKSSLKEGGESTTATAVGSQIGGNSVASAMSAAPNRIQLRPSFSYPLCVYPAMQTTA